MVQDQGVTILRWKRHRTGWICLGLGIVTLALFSPAVRHDFVAYDDQQYVTENPVVQAGLTWEGLKWAFGKQAGNWHPLTWVSHMLDCQLFGLRPWGHHLTNVLLHAASTALLFLLLHQMTGALWRSAAVAALFGWHPLHVESVAWVAERKDVLSGFFFVLAIWGYVEYAERREARRGFSAETQKRRDAKEEPARCGGSPRISQPQDCRPPLAGSPSLSASPPLCVAAPAWYSLALVFFTLGIMSKPMVVTLPFVLLLLDYWPLRRFRPAAGSRSPYPRMILEKVPFLALSAVSSVLTLSAQEPAMVSRAGLSLEERFAHALIAYTHYLGTLLLPRGLAVYYPYERAVPVGEILLAGMILGIITVFVVRSALRRPYLATGWFWFLGTLVPVIGLVQVGDQAWADRYSYLPSIGFFILAVWGLAEITETLGVKRWLCGGAAAAGGFCLLLAATMQLSHWENTEALFEHAAKVTKKNPLAATVLGSLQAEKGNLDEAIEYYRTSLSYAPGFPLTHFYLGQALDRQGKLEEAISAYEKARWFKPIQEQVYIALGAALAKQGKADQAATNYLAAIGLNSRSAIAHNGLGKLFHSQGRLGDAARHYAAAIRADPGLAQAHNNLGVLLLQRGQTPEGIAELREAMRLKPGDPECELNLAQALAGQKQWAEAADHFAKGVRGAAKSPDTHVQYATALVQLGRIREAMGQYAAALLANQDCVPALDGLAWVLATHPDPQLRNAEQALAMARRACDLTARADPLKLRTLAAACAEAGQFAAALATAQDAMARASATGLKDLADECSQMIEHFKASKPWRSGHDAANSATKQ
jgi:tetratricopeptide (TPR) repeat protein